MIKYLIITCILIVMAGSWVFYKYDEDRLNSGLDNQMALMLKNPEERQKLRESLMALNKQDSHIESFEGERNGPIHKAVVKTTDGNFYYLVYLEHHSNRYEINKVYVINDTDILDCISGHICGSVNIIGRCKDVNELISAIEKSD